MTPPLLTRLEVRTPRGRVLSTREVNRHLEVSEREGWTEGRPIVYSCPILAANAASIIRHAGLTVTLIEQER